MIYIEKSTVKKLIPILRATKLNFRVFKPRLTKYLITRKKDIVIIPEDLVPKYIRKSSLINNILIVKRGDELRAGLLLLKKVGFYD